MLYQLHDAVRKYASHPIAGALEKAHGYVNHPKNPLKKTVIGRLQNAALESGHRVFKQYQKIDYDLHSVTIDGKDVPVTLSVVQKKPFANLLRFKRQGLPKDAPKVLFVAAMSGHYATLSQDTFREFLPDHDIYVTDWQSARDVPLSEGRFGMEEYIGYVIEFLQQLGPNSHVIGLCQASVPVLCAAALMADDNDPAQPASMTLMAGPIDARINPMPLVKFFNDFIPPKLLKANLRTVPAGYKGAGRKVYPGHLQLAGFMSLAPKLHLQKHFDFFMDVFNDREEAAQKHREFYDEYLSGLDGTAEFFLETLQRVFIDYDLPEGRMKYQDRIVDCSKIKKTALLTVEGEKDNMCQLEQTEAAHELCSSLPESKRDHHIQPGVGHYGVFSGTLYRSVIAPHIKQFIGQHNRARLKVAS